MTRHGAVEIWSGLGFRNDAGIFTLSELPVAVIVLVTMAMVMFIRDNRRAFMANLVLVGVGLALAGISSLAFKAHLIGPVALMIALGAGLYLGYTPFNDVTARDFQSGDGQWQRSKSCDTFAPMGPYLVTADEILDPHNLRIRLWVNGALKQDFSTSDMAHKIPRCIEWVSSIHTLEPGDVLATGTNHRGLSSFQDGDVIELECEGLGKLRINVRDDLKRSWGRETRLDRQNRGEKDHFQSGVRTLPATPLS